MARITGSRRSSLTRPACCLRAAPAASALTPAAQSAGTQACGASCVAGCMACQAHGSSLRRRRRQRQRAAATPEAPAHSPPLLPGRLSRNLRSPLYRSATKLAPYSMDATAGGHGQALSWAAGGHHQHQPWRGRQQHQQQQPRPPHATFKNARPARPPGRGPPVAKGSKSSSTSCPPSDCRRSTAAWKCAALCAAMAAPPAPRARAALPGGARAPAQQQQQPAALLTGGAGGAGAGWAMRGWRRAASPHDTPPGGTTHPRPPTPRTWGQAHQSGSQRPLPEEGARGRACGATHRQGLQRAAGCWSGVRRA